MVIGNFKKDRESHSVMVDKWYFEIEIRSCSRGKFGIIKPWFFFACVKWLDFGQPGIFGGREPKKKGGWWDWEFPVGIEKIRFIR